MERGDRKASRENAGQGACRPSLSLDPENPASQQRHAMWSEGIWIPSTCPLCLTQVSLGPASSKAVLESKADSQCGLQVMSVVNQGPHKDSRGYYFLKAVTATGAPSPILKCVCVCVCVNQEVRSKKPADGRDSVWSWSRALSPQGSSPDKGCPLECLFTISLVHCRIPGAWLNA